MGKPTVVIAEDDFIIRDGSLCPLLGDFEIVAAVGTGKEAVAAVAEHRPEIVLLDVSLPGISGFEVARRILADQPACKVLFVSCYTDAAYVETAREIGASGYVLKNRVVTDLVTAIGKAQAGEFYGPQ